MPADLPVAAPDPEAEVPWREHDLVCLRTDTDPSPYFMDERGYYHALDCRGCRLAALLVERQQDKERIEAADRWLEGLESSYASPNRECEDEDVASGGTREGNTCIDSTEHDLLFPDDWCMRCYSLHVVRQARAALAVEEDAPKDQRFPPLEACDCGSAQEDHGWACRCDNPPSKRAAVEEDATP